MRRHDLSLTVESYRLQRAVELLHDVTDHSTQSSSVDGSSTLPVGQSAAFVATHTSQTLLSASTCYVHPSGPRLPSSSRHGASLAVRPAASCCWEAIKKPSPVVVHQSAGRPSVTSSHCRGPVICSSWSQDLEQSPRRHHFGSFAVSLPM